MRFHRIAVVLVGLAVLAPGAAGQERPQAPAARPGQVDLRPKFETGRESRYQLQMTSTMKQSQAGAPADDPQRRKPSRPAPRPEQEAEEFEPMRTRVEMALKLKVTEAKPEQGATVDLVIEHLKASIEGPAMTTEFDSREPAKSDDVGAMLFRSIAGTTMTLKVDAAGNITSVSGGEALAALGQMTGVGGVGAGLGGGTPAQLFSSIFSPGGSSGMAAVGESWEHTDTIESPLVGRIRMTTRHTLASMRGKEAVVKLRGRIEPASESTTEGAFTIRGVSHDGSYSWDTGAGLLRQMESTMSSEIGAKLGGAETVTKSESKLTIVRQR